MKYYKSRKLKLIFKGFQHLMIEGEPFIISVPGYHRPSYESDSCPGPNIITLELDSSFAIASPMYGISNYGNDLDCTWQVSAPEGMVGVIDCYFDKYRE